MSLQPLAPKRDVDIFPLWSCTHGNESLSLSKNEKVGTVLAGVAGIAFLGVGAIFALLGTSYYLKQKQCDALDSSSTLEYNLPIADNSTNQNTSEPKRKVGILPVWSCKYGNDLIELNKKEKITTVVMGIIGLLFLGVGAIFAFLGSAYYLKHRKCDALDTKTPSNNTSYDDNYIIDDDDLDMPNDYLDMSNDGLEIPDDPELSDDDDSPVDLSKITLDRSENVFSKEALDVLERLPKGGDYYVIPANDRIDGFHDRQKIRRWLAKAESPIIIAIRLGNGIFLTPGECRSYEIDGKDIPVYTLTWCSKNLPSHTIKSSKDFNTRALAQIKKDITQSQKPTRGFS